MTPVDKKPRAERVKEATTGLVERLRSVGRSFELGADYSIEMLCHEAADRIWEFEAALAKIADLLPSRDSEARFNEWGEAECFDKAQEIARAALKGSQP